MSEVMFATNKNIGVYLVLSAVQRPIPLQYSTVSFTIMKYFIK